MADETEAVEQAYEPPTLTSLGTIEKVTGGDQDTFSPFDASSDG